MDGITIGAVGAAAIAGIVSIIGLVIGKEQKVSEFRQSWIDELRKCLIAYLSNINAISDTIRTQKNSTGGDTSSLISSYKSLNEASNGIILRLNSKEKPSQKLLEAMRRFEDLANDNSKLTPDNIREAEKKFINASKALLKFEWKRVKRGEKTFIIAKWFAIISTVIMISMLVYIGFHKPDDKCPPLNSEPKFLAIR